MGATRLQAQLLELGRSMSTMPRYSKKPIVAKMERIEKHFGHAAPVFVQHLIGTGYPNEVDRLLKRVKDSEAFLIADGEAPQKRRVAGAASILLVAGQLAQEAGLIDQEYDLQGAVSRVLERSYARMARDMDPIETALVNLRERVLSRLGYDIREFDYEQDTVHREVVALFGYELKPSEFTSEDKALGVDERVYFIPVDQLMALGGGNVTAKAIARALNKQGYLLTPDKKNSLWPTMPRGEKINHYRVSGAFFHEPVGKGGAV